MGKKREKGWEERTKQARKELLKYFIELLHIPDVFVCAVFQCPS